MMSDRRSSRSRKTVSYGSFDDLSDDDFADTTPPPPKKQKSVKKDDGWSKTKLSSKGRGESQPLIEIEDRSSRRSDDSIRKRRVPVSDKIYERELQEALELSILETGGSQDVIVHGSGSAAKETEVTKVIENNTHSEKQLPNHRTTPQTRTENGEQCSPTTLESVSSFTEKPRGNPVDKPVSSMIGTIMDDSIELLEEVREEKKTAGKGNRPQRKTSGRQASKKTAVVISDDDQDDESDFNPESDGSDEKLDEPDDKTSSDDDDDGDEDFSAEDNDSDFDDKPKKRKGNQKNSKATSKSNKSPPKEKVTSKRSASKKEVSSPPFKGASRQPPIQPSLPVSLPSPCEPTLLVSKPSSSKTAASTKTTGKSVPVAAPVAHMKSWKPPARASPNHSAVSAVKSPTSGLRLGLSRNQRVSKPLHPSVKVL